VEMSRSSVIQSGLINEVWEKSLKRFVDEVVNGIRFFRKWMLFLL